MLRFLPFTLIVLCLWTSLQSQNLVSYSLRNSLSLDELKMEYEPNTPLERGVDIYIVHYTMLDVKGNLDTASGALSIPWPNGAEQFPMLCDMHGTTDRTAYPSKDFFQGPAYASHGFIVAEPDYLGLGRSRGFHPYIHAESEARSGVEMLRAVKAVLADLNITTRPELFISGYSQGGHSAMALHRMIQDSLSTEFQVTASSPMSGPYDITGTMFDRMMDDLNYIPGIVFMPYLILSYQEAYGNLFTNLNEVFKTPYVAAINNFYQGTSTMSSMATTLISLLLFNTGTLNPREMLRDDIVQIMQNDPESHPMWWAIADNHLLNWKPEVPMRLFYCEADEQVPYKNSTVAHAYFVGQGTTDVIAESKGATLNHGGCVLPASEATVAFFKSFLVSSTDQIVQSEDIHLFPNPATHYVHVRNTKSGAYLHGRAEVIDMNGNRVISDPVYQGTIPVGYIAAGMYTVRIYSDDGIHVTRFYKQ